MTKPRHADTQWDRYCALADTDARSAARFQDAGSYANTIETAKMTDEEWAEAFWTAYLSNGA